MTGERPRNGRKQPTKEWPPPTIFWLMILFRVRMIRRESKAASRLCGNGRVGGFRLDSGDPGGCSLLAGRSPSQPARSCDGPRGAAHLIHAPGPVAARATPMGVGEEGVGCSAESTR